LIKVHKTFTILLFFTLIFSSDITRAIKTTKENYGVNEGEIFDYTVVEKPERPGFTEGMEFPSGMGMDDIDNLTQLRLIRYL